MAVRVKLNPLFESMSGTLAKRYNEDGSVESIIITKNGIMYRRKIYPKRRSSGECRKMVP